MELIELSEGIIQQVSGERVYVVGDIHGCVDEPRVILEYLTKRERLKESDLVVFLGDYIDRGSDSKAVVDLLLQFKKNHGNTFFLKGNHEDMLVDFLLGEGRMGPSFLYNGGLDTITSYGLSLLENPSNFAQAMPVEHLDFYKGLLLGLDVGNFICVHAGLNPKHTLEEQNQTEVCWIREEFIGASHEFNKLVVFGHTPFRDVFVDLPFKVGIDTGLVFGNKLTCLELREGRCMQVARKSRKVSVSKIKLSVGS